MQARREIAASAGVICHLISEERDGSLVSNARAAVVAGMAMAQERVAVMVQEGDADQPIDYRDVALTYKSPAKIPALMEKPLDRVWDIIEAHAAMASPPSPNLLERIDLGASAAENEIIGLRKYYVQTGQYNSARKGHATLVLGRKGSGKTALFYSLRDSLVSGHGRLVLDLKPEGHQFKKLRERVLEKLSPGFQEHTMTAFWAYIILTEIARKAIRYDERWARNDPTRWARFERLRDVYVRHDPGQSDDFSQRILAVIERAAGEFDATDAPSDAATRLTEVVFKRDIHDLREAVVD